MPHAQSAGHWVAAWGTAQQFAVETLPDWVEPPPPDRLPDTAPPPPIPPLPAELTDRTLRMIVRSSIGGSRVRLQFSQALGLQPVHIGAVRIARHDGGSRIAGASDRAVTFSGRPGFTLRPGTLVTSDAVDLAVPALAELAVSVYLPESTDAITAHALGLNTTYMAPGDTVSDRSLPGAATNRSYFWLTGMEVQAPAEAAVIIAYGDSITDGYATTPDTHRAWPAVLAERLQRDPATARLGILNMGISGNRALRAGAGASALARFDRDVIARAGVAWLVLLVGINDITFSALPRAPDEERATADQIIEGLSQLVQRAHARGIRVMGATLTPFGGLWLHNAATEAMRQTVNSWIRDGGSLDAVVDFDAVTRDPLAPERLRPEYDSGDHIHPNDAGNAAMAAAIDIAVFTR
jgi:lysophospholipase L1-like esterase